jgi:hypothetical protein
MTRSDLHELVDKIPETEIDHIAMLVRAVREGNRPLIAALTSPPVDGEEMAWIEAALGEEPAAGDDPNLDERTYSTEEVRRELGAPNAPIARRRISGAERLALGRRHLSGLVDGFSGARIDHRGVKALRGHRRRLEPIV